MKISKNEYDELLATLEFLQDKVENCYRAETTAVLAAAKKKYLKFIANSTIESEKN